VRAERRDENPYVGPQPFERKDADRFFGREREARNAYSLVAAHRTIVVYAPSGVGKTSLINAALAPTLEDKGFEVLPLGRLRGPIAAPPSVRNVFVFNAITNWTKELSDPRKPAQSEGRARARAPDTGRVDEMRLVDFLGKRKHIPNEEGTPSPRVVIVDQVEEVFTLHPEHWAHRRPFFEDVRQALDADPLLKIVLALREDYLADLDAHADLFADRLRNRLRLERLREEPALAAVTGPLERTERAFAPGSAEKLVEDLRKVRVDTGTGRTIEIVGEFVEPVHLQVVCRTLWSALPAHVKRITRRNLREFGDVNQVLARSYSEAIEEAADETGIGEAELRSWFEQQFITSLGTRGTVYRTPLTTAGIPNEVIDVLESRRVLKAEYRANVRWYEITHDRLIEPILDSNKEFLMRALQPSIEEHEPSRRANKLLARSEEARSAYQLDGALALAREALAVYREHGDSHGAASTLKYIADLHLQVSDDESALQVYEQALEAYRDLGDGIGEALTLAGIGEIYLFRSEGEQAVKLFEDALSLYRELGQGRSLAAANALFNVAWVLLDAQDFTGAVDYLTQALQIFLELGDQAGVANTLTNIGHSYFNVGNSRAALEASEQALLLYKELGDRAGEAVARGNVGYGRLEIGDYEGALDALRKALVLFEETGDREGKARTSYHIGLAFVRAGRHPEAAEHFSSALALFRELGDRDAEADTLRSLGEVHFLMAEYEEAVACFASVLELEPDDVSAYRGRGTAYWYWGKLRQAIDDFTAGLELDPDALDIYSDRGQALAEMDEFERALVDLDHVVEDGADRELVSYARSGRGLAYAGLGEYERAREEFRASIRSRPGNAWAYFNRALMYELCGDPARALTDFRKALDKEDPPLPPRKRAVAELRSGEPVGRAAGKA
jgi:tetratricopeptide (TPR) repeat protein